MTNKQMIDFLESYDGMEEMIFSNRGKNVTVRYVNMDGESIYQTLRGKTKKEALEKLMHEVFGEHWEHNLE